MKLPLFILIISLFTISIQSCNDKSRKGKDIIIEKPVFKKSDGIELINHKPWQSNQPTTDGIQKMEILINAFTLSNNVEDYKTLKKSLEDEIITIFSKCTMKGKAHDELHNYLLPLHDMLKALDSEDISTCKNQIKVIKTQLSIYPIYFKS